MKKMKNIIIAINFGSTKISWVFVNFIEAFLKFSNWGIEVISDCA